MEYDDIGGKVPEVLLDNVLAGNMMGDNFLKHVTLNSASPQYRLLGCILISGPAPQNHH